MNKSHNSRIFIVWLYAIMYLIKERCIEAIVNSNLYDWHTALIIASLVNMPSTGICAATISKYRPRAHKPCFNIILLYAGVTYISTILFLLMAIKLPYYYCIISKTWYPVARKLYSYDILLYPSTSRIMLCVGIFCIAYSHWYGMGVFFLASMFEACSRYIEEQHISIRIHNVCYTAFYINSSRLVMSLPVIVLLGKQTQDNMDRMYQSPLIIILGLLSIAEPVQMMLAFKIRQTFGMLRLMRFQYYQNICSLIISVSPAMYLIGVAQYIGIVLIAGLSYASLPPIFSINRQSSNKLMTIV